MVSYKPKDSCGNPATALILNVISNAKKRHIRKYFQNQYLIEQKWPGQIKIPKKNRKK